MIKIAGIFLVLGVLSLGCSGGNSTGPSPADEIHGWIVGNSQSGVTILHTTDGITWTSQGTELSINAPELIAVSTVDSLCAWAAGGTSDGYGIVLRTTDAGQTWNRLGSESQIPEGTISIAALSEDAAWVGGGNNSIYSTTDGGNTWQDHSDPAYAGNSWQGIHPISMTDIWMCGGNDDGVIIHTMDGGYTWTSHADSLLQDYYMITITGWDTDNIWAVGHGFSILKTTDSGQTWENVAPDSMQGSPNDANGITLLSPDDAWVVLDYGNIWKTSNGGETWTAQTPPSGLEGFFYFRISAQDLHTAWATGGSPTGSQTGAIIYTTDGGTKWTRQDDGSHKRLWGVSFVGDRPN